MDTLRMSFSGIEIAALCLMAKQAGEVTYMDLSTRATMEALLERIRTSVKVQAPAYLPVLESQE